MLCEVLQACGSEATDRPHKFLVVVERLALTAHDALQAPARTVLSMQHDTGSFVQLSQTRLLKSMQCDCACKAFLLA
eukprot:878000-Amphidinium_carterae.1